MAGFESVRGIDPEYGGPTPLELAKNLNLVDRKFKVLRHDGSYDTGWSVEVLITGNNGELKCVITKIELDNHMQGRPLTRIVALSDLKNWNGLG